MELLKRGDHINALVSSAYSGALDRRDFLKALTCLGVSASVASALALHAEQAASVQRRNRERLLRSYDYVIVGGGPSRDERATARSRAERPSATRNPRS